MKTDPPQTSEFSLETTQWMIFDAYMQVWEDNLRAVSYKFAMCRKWRNNKRERRTKRWYKSNNSMEKTHCTVHQ